MNHIKMYRPIINRFDAKSFLPEKQIANGSMCLILNAGRLGPKEDNRPWHFFIRKGKDVNTENAELEKIIQSAPHIVSICRDAPEYSMTDQDLMAIGACVENMMIQAKSMDIDSLWFTDEYILDDNGLKCICHVLFGYSNELPDMRNISKVSDITVWE